MWALITIMKISWLNKLKKYLKIMLFWIDLKVDNFFAWLLFNSIISFSFIQNSKNKNGIDYWNHHLWRKTFAKWRASLQTVEIWSCILSTQEKKDAWILREMHWKLHQRRLQEKPEQNWNLLSCLSWWSVDLWKMLWCFALKMWIEKNKMLNWFKHFQLLLLVLTLIFQSECRDSLIYFISF